MKIVIIILFVALSWNIFSVSTVNAQPWAPGTPEYEAETGLNAGGNLGGGGSATQLSNPLGDNDDPRKIVGNIIKAVLGIVGSLALLVFILGGLSWVTSAGNDEKVKKGKDMIIWATLGLIVIFTSYTLVGFVLDALTGL